MFALKSYADVAWAPSGRRDKNPPDGLRNFLFRHSFWARQENKTPNQINPFMKISARNVIPGKIKNIKKGPITALVTLEIVPGIEIVSSITSASAISLKLKKGQTAYAIIKSSSVMIGAD